MQLSWCHKGGSRGYRVIKPLEWHVGMKNSGLVVIVPVGQEFESSVPWLFRWFWSPDDPVFLKSAAIHDHVLEQGWRPAAADVQWFESALSEHAPGFKTQLAFTGMRFRRMWQWLTWNRNAT